MAEINFLFHKHCSDEGVMEESETKGRKNRESSSSEGHSWSHPAVGERSISILSQRYLVDMSRVHLESDI